MSRRSAIRDACLSTATAWEAVFASHRGNPARRMHADASNDRGPNRDGTVNRFVDAFRIDDRRDRRRAQRKMKKREIREKFRSNWSALVDRGVLN